MAAKQNVHALPKHMSPHRRAGRRLAYKYVRRVPQVLHDLLGRKVWDLSLGSDQAKAMKRCHALTVEHDHLIARLATQEQKQAYADSANSETAAAMAEAFVGVEAAEHVRFGFDGTATVLTAIPETQLDGLVMRGSRPDQDLWRQTEETLARAESMSKRSARDQLALFAAYAFGDNSHLERLDAADAFGNKLVAVLTPERPEGIAGAAVFDALKSALDARIYELDSAVGADSKHRLSALRDEYFALQGLAEKTKVSYATKTNSLIAVCGDLPLTQYTPERLRQWRDHLHRDKQLSPQSIASYFKTIRTIMHWALKEELVPGFDALPTDKVSLPRIVETVEETRWQRFDDAEIKRVWKLLQAGWGKDSRLSLEQCSAFKMAFRVLLHTALRPVEVFQLTAADVTPDLIRVRKTKTKIPRDMPLARAIADFHDFMHREGFTFFKSAGDAAGAMSESFSQIIRAGGLGNHRQVLYSCKDTLVDRLQRAGHSDDVIRGFTGHVTQGSLRNYKTRLNDTPEGLAILREAIDGVRYW